LVRVRLLFAIIAAGRSRTPSACRADALFDAATIDAATIDAASRLRAGPAVAS
jgi:hypothetical protein